MGCSHNVDGLCHAHNVDGLCHAHNVDGLCHAHNPPTVIVFVAVAFIECVVHINTIYVRCSTKTPAYLWIKQHNTKVA